MCLKTLFQTKICLFTGYPMFDNTVGDKNSKSTLYIEYVFHIHILVFLIIYLCMLFYSSTKLENDLKT